MTVNKRVRFFSETMGLSPIGLRIEQAATALFGEDDVPRSKFGLSSLRILKPRVAIPLWRGKQLVKNKVIISSLFNHTPTPVEEGWSVQKTQVQDFRGKGLTYNSHNGTDLAIPIGSAVLAAAPGQVVSIRSEFNRGGLKITLDHGFGVMTVSVHLARALVKLGDIVKRGERIAISGYSGLDGFATFPFGIPHVHYNTWLNGIPVDPFGVGVEASLWKSGGMPLPYSPSVGTKEEVFAPSRYNDARVAEAIAECKTERVRERLSEITDLQFRAAEVIAEMNYYPTRFFRRVSVYSEEFPRTPILDLPFNREVFDGAVLMDEVPGLVN